MKKLLASIALALVSVALVISPVRAQNVSPGGSTITSDLPYVACEIKSSAAVTCPYLSTASPHLVLGYLNGAAVAQTITTACLDRNGVGITFGPTGINQQLNLKSPGFPYAPPYVCMPSAAPTGGSVFVLLR